MLGVAYSITPGFGSRLLILGTNESDLAELDVYRCVNNGHSVAWWRVGADWRLTTTWMAPPSAGGMIRVATMEVGRWIRGMFHRAWLPPEERPPYHTGYEAYSPTLSVVPGLPAVVGWLEHESLPRVHGPHAVCEAWVDALAHAAVLWEGDVSLLAWGAAWVAPELKFLAAAGNAVDRTYVLTAEDGSLLDPGMAGAQDLEAWQVDRSAGKVRLSMASPPPLSTEDGRASDPTVAYSPDGRTRLVAWEERTGADDVRVRWAWDVWDGDPSTTFRRFGPYFLDVGAAGTETDAGGGGAYVARTEASVAGGDACVWMTGHFAYIAWQSSRGSIRVARLAASWLAARFSGSTTAPPPSITDPPVWQLPGDGTEALGPGWFVNLGVETIDGEDLAAAVWEQTEDTPAATDKTVGLALLRSTESAFRVVRRDTIGVPVEDGAIWFAKTPAVAVSPQGAKAQFGITTVEVVYYLVRGEAGPRDFIYDATLVHVGLAFDSGDFLT